MKNGICSIQKPEDLLPIITRTEEKDTPETINTLMIAYIGTLNAHTKTYAIAAGVEASMKRENLLLKKEDKKSSEVTTVIIKGWCFAATGSQKMTCTQNIPDIAWDENTTKETEIQFQEKGEDKVLFNRVIQQYLKYQESVEKLRILKQEAYEEKDSPSYSKKGMEERAEMGSNINEAKNRIDHSSECTRSRG